MSEKIWLVESPLTMIEGEEIAFSVTWTGAALLEVPECKVFKNGVDISETVLISGDENSISGNVQTLKRITALPGDGGTCYVVEICATVDNNIEKRKLLIQIVKPGEEG